MDLESVLRLLPQTQCERCDYPGCKPYAQAMLEGEAINKCVPGGENTMKALAHVLGRAELAPQSPAPKVRQIAKIREDLCIGCTKCIQACPVDAIVGAPQQMHTVLSEHCTGCELCVPPCPVHDCIEIVGGPEPIPSWIDSAYPATLLKAQEARGRFESKDNRMRVKEERLLKVQQAATAKKIMQQEIAASVKRAKAKREKNHEPA